MSLIPQTSAPFQGISTPADVVNAFNSGTLSQQDALTILANMGVTGGAGLPPLQLSSPSATLPNQQTELGMINSIPGQSAQTIANAAASNPANGCPSFSITNPIPWFQCEGLNLLLMFFGVAGIVIVFSSMFKGSPVVESAAALAGV